MENGCGGRETLAAQLAIEGGQRKYAGISVAQAFPLDSEGEHAAAMGVLVDLEMF